MTLKQMYEAEVKRIERQIKRLEKRGFEFAKPVLPKVPKRIRRESVGRLQKIDLPSIKSKATKAPEPKRSKGRSIVATTKAKMPRVNQADDPKTGRVRNINRAEYAKQRRRINSFLRRAEKRGFVVPEELYQKPNMYPSDRDVERLRSISTTELYSKIYGVDSATGEVISGVEERDRRRKESARRGAETRRRNKEKKEERSRVGDVVLRNVEDRIANFDTHAFRSITSRVIHEENNNELRAMLELAIAEYGRTAVGERLYRTGDSLVYSTVEEIQYSSDDTKVQPALTAFASWINGGPLDQEQSKRIEAMAEQYDTLEY